MLRKLTLQQDQVLSSIKLSKEAKGALSSFNFKLKEITEFEALVRSQCPLD
jgi:hypothetical protein